MEIENKIETQMRFSQRWTKRGQRDRDRECVI